MISAQDTQCDIDDMVLKWNLMRHRDEVLVMARDPQGRNRKRPNRRNLETERRIVPAPHSLFRFLRPFSNMCQRDLNAPCEEVDGVHPLVTAYRYRGCDLPSESDSAKGGRIMRLRCTQRAAEFPEDFLPSCRARASSDELLSLDTLRKQLRLRIYLGRYQDDSVL